MSMARLCGCAGSSEPSLGHVQEVASHEPTQFVKHDAEAGKNQFTS